MPKKMSYVLLAVTAAAALGSVSRPLAGQGMARPGENMMTDAHVTVGYVANAPEQLVGFGVTEVGLPWAGWGAFADLKLTVGRASGEDTFIESMTAREAEEMGDVAFGEPEEAWTTVNFGLIRAVGPEVALYAGAGYSEETVYQEYDRQESGADRFYIVEDPRAGGDEVNLLGGLFFRAGRYLMFQMGGETAPAGFTAGASLVFPLSG